MTEKELDWQFNLFAADENLLTLCELQRIGDEVLDVINLSENQHSDILAWLLDPREGHGQGDNILRDLLVAASVQANQHDRWLDANSETAMFFREWTPAKIRTSGFGSVFYAREFGHNRSQRVDLYIIDPQNKFIILIENKSGISHNHKQLSEYKNSFENILKENRHLASYQFAYIALDKNFSEFFSPEEMEKLDSEKRERKISQTPGKVGWLHIGYDWLKSSATRALEHVSRGNAAAQLVVSYCKRQSDWHNDPEEKRCVELAALLTERYPETVRELINISKTCSPATWFSDANYNFKLIFTLQNKYVMRWLEEAKGLNAFRITLEKRLPNLSQINYETTRNYLHVCPEGWEDGSDWPLYLTIAFGEKSNQEFRVWVTRHILPGMHSDEFEEIHKKTIACSPEFASQKERVTSEIQINGDLKKDAAIRLTIFLLDKLRKN
ncbi:PDDEXK-like family protein [Comamonas sp. MYb69]|uniref:PDDEXK-like family protein n=1 Tax=Comamonas sp. MYb69 TaxID=1848650 RepID=UPI0030B25A64